MPRRKKLKTNGSSILSFSVNVETVKSNTMDTMIEIIILKITTNDGEFSYEICKDTRAPNLEQAKSHIEASLKKAKTDLLNIEISEYTERDYLFFEVQKIGQEQYTGRRI